MRRPFEATHSMLRMKLPYQAHALRIAGNPPKATGNSAASLTLFGRSQPPPLAAALVMD
jgi:hypothetical protein